MACISTSRDTLKIKSLVHHSSDPRPRSAEIPGYTSATVPGDEPAAAERPAAPCAELRVTSRLGRPPTFWAFFFRALGLAVVRASHVPHLPAKPFRLIADR